MTRQGRMHHKKAKKQILTQDLNHSLTNQCTRFFLHWYLGFKAIALTVPDRNKSNSSYNKTQIRWHYCFTVVIYGKIINNFKVSYFGHMTVVREKRQYWLLCFPPGVRMIRSLKNVFTLIFLQFSLPFLLVLQNAGSHLPTCLRTTQTTRSLAGASVILILFPNKIYSKNYQQANSHA